MRYSKRISTDSFVFNGVFTRSGSTRIFNLSRRLIGCIIRRGITDTCRKIARDTRASCIGWLNLECSLFYYGKEFYFVVGLSHNTFAQITRGVAIKKKAESGLRYARIYNFSRWLLLRSLPNEEVGFLFESKRIYKILISDNFSEI